MWTIYLKELLELTRDRKTLIFTILIPIFAMPLIFGGFAYVSSNMFKNAKLADMSYAMFGKQHSPGLSERFSQQGNLHEVSLTSESEIRQAIADERIKFAVVIPPNFDTALQQQQQARITLHYNSASTVDVTQQRVREIVDAYNTSLRSTALSALGLNADQLAFALNPIVLDKQSTANQREQMGAIVGGILPYLLLMVCLTAAMYPAIDLGAGEKERGTLETLLLAPVPRGAIVLAKFLVLFTVGMTSAVLMVGSMAGLLLYFGNSLEGNLALLVRSIGLPDLAMVTLMLVPTAAIFASLLLSISIYAKSYKEAAGMITPLMLLIILPTVVAMLPGVELNWMWSMVPLTNVSLAMKELVKGTMDYRMFGVILASTTVIAGALLLLCRWWFKRESVLFRN
ncbi:MULTISPECIES: ABC transporter permease [unclassified Janthinobacterium]|uniref:ABC transporter permease n=1 Tax=unclassified Janthinobacterium TaxID=2610881 RepID=UPI00160D2E94|nr:MULTISPECIES: ABC transporter permease [unclassified Janthinobacterium]MBB5370438.1 sodium transport system permease protein [Janthinobacterium sp. K2C7]MBB5383348.1 sodium transport system permease protein [Janthinobacterium sp. K2Li3]MBB5388802.1 sodium transport system permease protein [Janthinobacterium sp. K2E3]